MESYEALRNSLRNGGGHICVETYDSTTSSATSDAKSRMPTDPLCKFFFLSNYCRNGNNCRFSHEAPYDMTREEALKTISCPHFAKGTCCYGSRCQLKHEVSKAEIETDAVCGICLENSSERRRQFGIQSCCNHIFCYDCLMEWRTEGSEEVTCRRMCPTCRKASDYVVPSTYIPSNDKEKAELLGNHKNKLAKIRCRNFAGLGTCLFGSDCFYAHLDEKGNDIKSFDKTMQELYEERKRRKSRRCVDTDAILEMLMTVLQRDLYQGQRGHADNDRFERERSVLQRVFYQEYYGLEGNTLRQRGQADNDRFDRERSMYRQQGEADVDSDVDTMDTIMAHAFMAVDDDDYMASPIEFFLSTIRDLDLSDEEDNENDDDGAFFG